MIAAKKPFAETSNKRRKSLVPLWLALSHTALLFFITGCGDVPFTQTTSHNIDGVVEIGAPVRNAKISAYRWKDLRRGELLQTTESDVNGKFALSYSAQYDGPVLLVAVQGKYTDPYTHTENSFESDEELLSSISQPGEKVSINVNAWTTFAAARAQGTRKAFVSDIEAVAKNLMLIGSHLRNEKNPVAILTAASVDIFRQSESPSSDNVLLALTHQGFSDLASKNSVTLARLIHVLSEDVSDGIWSGTLNGEQLFFDRNQTLPVNAQATRHLLAEAIDDFLSVVAAEKKLQLKFDRTELQKTGGLFESLCFDVREVLYTPSAPPQKLEPIQDAKVRQQSEKDLKVALLATGNDKDRALFWLVKQNKPNAIALAKSAGANPNVEDESELRPIYYAVTNNNEEVVKALILAGAELNYRAGNALPPLHEAARGKIGGKGPGFLSLIKLLVESGADVNWTRGSRTALQIAVFEHGDPSTVQLLITLGANVNAIDGLDDATQVTTAAHVAVLGYKIDALKLLLTNGADPYLKDGMGRTVFDLAGQLGDMGESLKILQPYRR